MNTPENIFSTLYKSYPALLSVKNEIEGAFALLRKCAEENAFIYCCGNGGSAADSEHIAGELMKGFILKRPLPKEENLTASKTAEKLQISFRRASDVSPL